MADRLEFRGESTSLLGDLLLVALLSAVTLGLYGPWGVARMRRAVLSRTYYRGEALRYDGTGGQLLGLFLKNLLLSLITVGIYALLCYPIVSYLQYDASHTILPDGTRLEYRGSATDLLGQLLAVALLSAVTFGVYSFWGYVSTRRRILGNTWSTCGVLQFHGTGTEYLGIRLVNALLCALTLGIYGLLGCALVRQVRWDASSTEMPPMPEARGEEPLPSNSGPMQVTVTLNPL